jgi:hypothetical protein
MVDREEQPVRLDASMERLLGLPQDDAVLAGCLDRLERQ